MKKPSKAEKPKNLLQIAIEINALAVEVDSLSRQAVNRRVQMGHLLYEAQKRISTESNMDFSEWCKNYVRKADGAPFSFTTIKNYIRFSRYPKTLASDKKQKKEYQEKIREAAKKGGGFKTYGSGRPTVVEDLRWKKRNVEKSKLLQYQIKLMLLFRHGTGQQTKPENSLCI